jgi:hypothetical protein
VILCKGVISNKLYDYDPMRDKREYGRARNLSDLQKALLKKALRAYCSKPMDIAVQVEVPGCFGVRTVGRIPDPDAFTLRRKNASAEERRKNASLRAAAGLSVARLIKRGLVECCSRGKWRLTGAGLKVAQKLWPELKPMSKKEVASKISFREAMHSVVPRLRKRPRAKAPQDFGELSQVAPKKVADTGEPGIEIPFDY